MSHFYSRIKGRRGEATRCGTKGSGIDATAASWSGSIVTRMWHDDATGRDMYEVAQRPWHGSGVQQVLATGVVGEHTSESLITRRLIITEGSMRANGEEYETVLAEALNIAMRIVEANKQRTAHERELLASAAKLMARVTGGVESFRNTLGMLDGAGNLSLPE